MKTYNFSFFFNKLNVEFEEAADLLYEVCNDCTFSSSDGEFEVEFDRDANSYKEAVNGAMSDIMRSTITSNIDETIRHDSVADRYQYQSWYIKLWRRRYYILIPIDALRIYVNSKKEKGYELSWRNSYSIAIGSAQGKMNWVYSSEEVFERLGWNELDEEDSYDKT